MQTWRVDFLLVYLMLVHVSSKKMRLERNSIYHLKAHRISNNMILELQRQGKKKVMVCLNSVLKIVFWEGLA